jgi:hypothetical protein
MCPRSPTAQIPLLIDTALIKSERGASRAGTEKPAWAAMLNKASETQKIPRSTITAGNRHSSRCKYLPARCIGPAAEYVP